MIREGMPIGVINIRRMEVRPFSERHVKLLETFANQAVIAIENVRLVQRTRRAQRRIARGAGASDGNRRGARHHQPLADGRAAGLDAIVESAARVCGIDDVVLRLREGNDYGSAGSFWSHTHWPVESRVLMSHSFAGCASMARSTFPTLARAE